MHIAMLVRTLVPTLVGMAMLMAAFAPTAFGASTVRMEPVNLGGVEAVWIAGDDGGSTITVQRTTLTGAEQGVPGLAGKQAVEITDTTGVTRDGAYNVETLDYCSDITADTVRCYVAAGSGVSTAGTTLGGGGDILTLVPAAVGSEVLLDVEGGPGNDILVGGPGRDRFDGGPGSDQLAGLAGGDFLLDTGTDPGDVDTVAYNDAAHGTTGVSVTLDDGNSNDGTEGVDGDGPLSLDNVGAGIDRLVGSDFDDFVFGSDASETLVGGLGTDALYGQGGDDRLEARDATVDGTLDCGAGTDTAIVDADDPQVAHCESVDRPVAASTPPEITSTLRQIALPDIRKGVYAGLSIDGIEDELSKVVPSSITPQPLDYAQAASRAGKAKVTPFDIIGSSPAAGARVSGSLGNPVKVRAFFWDPTKDVRKQACNSDVRVRGKGGRGPKLSLKTALKGLGFREGKAGNEGDAQDLLRKIGCPYDATFTYSAKAKEARVVTAQFTKLTRKTKSGTAVKTTTVKGYKLRVQAPREENDFLTTYTQPVTQRDNELPLSQDLTMAVGKTLRLVLNVREKATGRIAEGTLAELIGPGGVTVASGKTDSGGMVSFTGYIAAKGDYDLFLSRSRSNPVTGETVHQEGITALQAVTPGASWTTVSGSTITLKKGARAAAGDNNPITFFLELANAFTAKAIADAVSLSAGLTQAQVDQLLPFYLKLLNVPLDSPAAIAVGVRKLNLVPAIAATRAGKLCPTWEAPAIETRSAVGLYKDDAIAGKAVGARFDCGRAVMIDPDTGLVLIGNGYAIGSALIANDGASLIANDGASLISDHGAGLLANDGASFVPLSPLLANDGASLISDHGAGIVSNNSGAIVSNHSSGFVQPLGAGTTFQSVGR